jgi:hypothetical protein
MLAPTREATEKCLTDACEEITNSSSRGEAESVKKHLRQILMAASVLAQQNGLDAEEILYDCSRNVTEAVERAEEQYGKDFSGLSETERREWAAHVFFSE